MSLKSRLAIRLALTVPLAAALMGVPAGSVRFWQGWIFTAALGSYVTLLPAILLIRLLLFRLRDEERVLWQELPDYTEYCKRTHFRLLPIPPDHDKPCCG